MDKSTVCMGYAKATQYLLNQMGIFCTLVTGTVADGSDSGHAWNLVIFLDKSTVCMGYAKATQYLLNQMGIFCTLVTGTVADGSDSGHAWNLVKIQDSYYYVDTTWGNPGYADAGDSGIDVIYSYLCCSDSMLRPTHKADGTIPLPACEDDSYNYYKRKGCWYETYDRTKIYVCCSDSMLRPTHKADGTIPLPACEDDSYNYYKRKGCWYETYDRTKIYEILSQTINGKPHMTEFCFASWEAYNQAVADMVDGTLLQDVIQNIGSLSPGQQTINGKPHMTEFCFASWEAYNQAVADMVDGTLLQDVIQNIGSLSPGQQVSWKIYYGGWDKLLVIVWN